MVIKRRALFSSEFWPILLDFIYLVVQQMLWKVGDQVVNAYVSVFSLIHLAWKII